MPKQKEKQNLRQSLWIGIAVAALMILVLTVVYCAMDQEQAPQLPEPIEETLPQSYYDPADFQLDENLKPFVEHYAKEYAEEDLGTTFNGGQSI